MTKQCAILAAALVLAASACGSSDEDSDPEPFDVSGYDRTCAATSECFLVYSGDPCGCSCDQVAIASSEQGQYFADRDAYMEQACPDGAVICAACPPSPEVGCSDGQCAVLP